MFQKKASQTANTLGGGANTMESHVTAKENKHLFLPLPSPCPSLPTTVNSTKGIMLKPTVRHPGHGLSQWMASPTELLPPPVSACAKQTSLLVS